MGLVMCVCQLDFENGAANFWTQHYPLLPPKTLDNKNYIFTEFNEIFPLFAHSVPQTTLTDFLGKDFDPHFIGEGNRFRETNNSLEDDRNNQHLKVFRKIFWKLNKTWTRMSCLWQETKECKRAWPSASLLTGGVRFTKSAQTNTLPTIKSINFL